MLNANCKRQCLNMGSAAVAKTVGVCSCCRDDAEGCIVVIVLGMVVIVLGMVVMTGGW